MNLTIIRLFILLCSFGCAYPALSQGTANQQVIENTIASYNKAIGQHSQLYRGAIYEYYDPIRSGSPYFKDSIGFTNGSILYYGIHYKNVPLIYDQYLKQVVTLLHNNYSKLFLMNEGISAFDMYGHHFIRLLPDELNNKMDAEFYDELYNSSKLQLLVKRVKKRQIESLTSKIVFYPSDTYYIKKGATYKSVKTKGQVLDVLNDKKQELKKYLKDNHIDYSDNKEQAMVMLLTYYDSITN
jgi:hypothetical protein